MKELIQYTSEFELFDPEKPFLESEYNILITHDNSKELIEDKFIINFLNSEMKNIAKMNVNTWCVTNIIIDDYYGRAKIKVEIKESKQSDDTANETIVKILIASLKIAIVFIIIIITPIELIIITFRELFFLSKGR